MDAFFFFHSLTAPSAAKMLPQLLFFSVSLCWRTVPAEIGGWEEERGKKEKGKETKTPFFFQQLSCGTNGTMPNILLCVYLPYFLQLFLTRGSA